MNSMDINYFYMYVCIYVCMYVCYLRLQDFEFMYGCMYVCMYVCTHYTSSILVYSICSMYICTVLVCMSK